MSNETQKTYESPVVRVVEVKYGSVICQSGVLPDYDRQTPDTW